MNATLKLQSNANRGSAIRAYREEDFATLCRIDQGCFPRGIAYTQEEMLDFLLLPAARVWVAEEQQPPGAAAVVGFILIQRWKTRAHIITLDVDRDHRRSGIGSALLRAAEEWLRTCGVRRVRLETATGNEAAVAFWQHAGYRVSGLLKRYYLNSNDAYRCEKDLA